MAWKTSFGFRPHVTQLSFATASISDRGDERRRGRAEAVTGAAASADRPTEPIRDRLTVGRHALNVEIEVRSLVPELLTGGRLERSSYKREAAGSTPASPTCSSWP